MSTTASCTIKGDADLYGLGIRVGIYLQWVSAWVSLFLDESSAQSVYDVNSIFVFAVVIATIVATFQQSAIHPIETHIMLQFALGFFVTSLSTFGSRLSLIRPSSTTRLIKELNASFKKARESNGTLVTLPLRALSPLKPRHLSWSGVLWRASIVFIIAMVNLLFWWDSANYRLHDQSCAAPSIFIFSRQQLSNNVVIFLKTVSIIILVVTAPPTFLLIQIGWSFLTYMSMTAWRDIILYFNPEAPQILKRNIDRMNSLFEEFMEPINAKLERYGISHIPTLYELYACASIGLFSVPGFPTTFELIEFMSKSKDEIFHLSDIFRLVVYLGKGSIKNEPRTSVQQQGADGQADNRRIQPQKTKEASTLGTMISILLNIFILSSIVWFILSIELTLKWNTFREGNRDIYSLRSTGQLIPFVIGCVSTAQVVKKIFLKLLEWIYNDWEDVTLELLWSYPGSQLIDFKIRKKTIDDDDTNGTAAA